MRVGRAIALGVWAGAFLAGCATTGGGRGGQTQEVAFEPVQIVGDLELEKLNDEELFAGGTSAYAAEDYKKAARYFGRLADFHPHSSHRRAALYNAGLALERIKEWEEAYMRFSELADPQRGDGDALDAAFRVAETLYHLERFEDCAATLEVIANRGDLGPNKRIEAQVQHGICLLEGGQSQAAETSLRKALAIWNDLGAKEEVDDYFPGQAQFFLGEIYRLHYESVQLDPAQGVDKLAQDLEYKAQLLLSAQGHYLRSIRIGNGHWATASGARVGGLYENLYDHMVNSPAPPELSGEEVEVYRQELRKKIRVLITKAISIYERTIETAERIGAQSAFVDDARGSLKKMKELLLSDARREEEEAAAAASEEAPAATDAEPHS